MYISTVVSIVGEECLFADRSIAVRRKNTCK